ncbi:MAG: hypothetical protein NTW49_03180, partial [Bacteroidia bacterium]|nr:hypothetical protein [Bacteroidia bacterium]
MRNTVFSAMIIILFSGWATAQNEEDALRYSQEFYGGTARFMGMGGAFGSLGGDFSSLSINPAGLGIYRKAEFTLTPDFQYNKSNSSYYGTNFEDFKYNTGLSNIGIVGVIKSGNEHGWISTNVAFGYNRLNNFDYNTTIIREKATSSLVDVMVHNANAENPAPKFDSNKKVVIDDPVARIAYDNQLIYLNPDSTRFVSDFTGSNYGQSQRRTIESSGYTGEYVISVASNFNDKIYVGGTMGIQKVDYETHFNHTEDNIPADISFLNSFTYSEDLRTTGTGMNFKLGIIGKPLDWLRIGAAVHSPTFYDLTDKYYYEVNSNLSFDNGGPVKYIGENDYKITTPLRAIGSVSVVLAKLAIVSMDYEVVDYSTMRLRDSGDGYDFEPENTGIQQHFTTATNIHAGAEFRFGQISLRGGYAHYGSPYASGQTNVNADYSQVSGGIGINNNNFFLDLSFVQNLKKKK